MKKQRNPTFPFFSSFSAQDLLSVLFCLLFVSLFSSSHERLSTTGVHTPQLQRHAVGLHYFPCPQRDQETRGCFSEIGGVPNFACMNCFFTYLSYPFLIPLVENPPVSFPPRWYFCTSSSRSLIFPSPFLFSKGVQTLCSLWAYLQFRGSSVLISDSLFHFPVYRHPISSARYLLLPLSLPRSFGV